MECVLQERSGKGIVKDYFSRVDKFQSYRAPPYAYKTLMEMVKADPVMFTATSLTVDLSTYKGYSFIGGTEEQIKNAKELFNDKLDFDQVIENILFQLLVYGDAFLEVVWNEEKTQVIELKPLESSQMAINYTESGDIVGYVQKIEGKSELDFPQFAPDEVVYFRHYWIGSQVYSYSPFEAIRTPYTTKIYANDYLKNIFINLPPKIIYFLSNASETQRKLFIENLIRAKTNPGLDIIAQGEKFESKLLQVSFDSGLINVLEYLRKEVMMITRVPPHWIGVLDGANRGIGENVVIPYETKIKKIQQKVSSQLNRQLMPLLNLDLDFKWNAVSLMDERTIVEIMNFLKSQGFDSETIIDYARERGLDLRQGASIEVTPPLSSNQVLQNETAQSRLRENPKSQKMNDNLNKKGVSEEGKAKLEMKKVAA